MNVVSRWSTNTFNLRYLHWQNSTLLFSLLFCLQCSLVLLFYRNIDFGTKYPREDENSEAKICPFTGSQWYFQVRNWVGCQGLHLFTAFSRRIFCPGRCFVWLFLLFEPCLLRGRHVWYKICSQSSKVKHWETGSLGRVPHLATCK